MIKITRLHHVQIAMPAGEEDRARAFYIDMLGFQEVPKPPELIGRGGAWFASGPVSVHLGIEPGFRPAPQSAPGFRRRRS